MSSSLGPHRLQPAKLICPWDSPVKNTKEGCHSLLQGIFPTQGSNPGLLHGRQILHCLSYQGSPPTQLDIWKMRTFWHLKIPVVPLYWHSQSMCPCTGNAQHALMRNSETYILIPTALGYISELPYLRKEVTSLVAAECTTMLLLLRLTYTENCFVE